MRWRDFRNAGWCWQEKAALDVLRGYYDGDRLKQRTTAIAIYVAITELASDQRNTPQVEVTHRELWQMTGTSESTVKRYLRELEELGLVTVERRKTHPDVNLPNVYGLLSPGATDGPTPSIGDRNPGATHSPTPSTNGHQIEEPTLNKDPEESKEGIPTPTEQQIDWKRTQLRRLVGDLEERRMYLHIAQIRETPGQILAALESAHYNLTRERRR